jgi:acetyl esterase/lipase
MSRAKLRFIGLIASSLIAGSIAVPATGQTPRPIATPRDHHAILLHAAAAASAHGAQEQWEEVDGRRSVRNVTQPTLTPVLPAPDRATGTAVIVIPGAHNDRLQIDNEGFHIARVLADRGVAALVLKYRTGPSPGQAEAAEDTRHALLIAKARAREMGVNPAHIGLLGFSSSAAALLALALDDPASRPAFVASVRGVSMPMHAVPANAPPLFAALEARRSDPSTLAGMWRKAGAPVKVHTGRRGGRSLPMDGSGMKPEPWIEGFRSWLQTLGLAPPI